MAELSETSQIGMCTPAVFTCAIKQPDKFCWHIWSQAPHS